MKLDCMFERLDYGMRIVPVYSSDADKLSTLKQNTEYRIEVSQPRNPQFHRKFMALVRVGFENQERIHNEEHYRKIVTMKAGHYDTIETDKGVVYLPRSIAFDKMDQQEFERVFNGVLDVIAEQLKTAPQEIIDNLNSFM